MRLIPFQGHHLEEIGPQPAQGFVVPHLSAAWGHVLERAGPCYSAVHDAEIIGCSGVVVLWPERGIAWACLAETGARVFLRIHRMVQRFLDNEAPRRLEIYVRSDYADGHRWARLLGFGWEAGPLKQFDPDGNSYDMYVRFRDV